MSTMTQADQHNAMVAFVLDYLERNGAKGDLSAALGEHFPDATGRDTKRALEEVTARLDEEMEVRTLNHRTEQVFNDACLKLFAGLPDDIELGEAVRIRAEQGDEFALWLIKNPDRLLDRMIEIPGDAT